MNRLRVLVLGGYGLFGRRLVERLSRVAGLHLTVAGRDAGKAHAAVKALGDTPADLDAVALDHSSPSFASELARLAPDLTIHCAGPFQGQDYAVAWACIAAKSHYVDLADGRAFVTGIVALDQAARSAGVGVISGASSVPALSGAVISALSADMAQVRAIDIGISPGNRTERGLSTVAAVLGYCGQPIGPDMSDVGAQAHGWCGTWTHRYPDPVGSRLLSPCDVPDLALWPERFPGARVRFGAGLELRNLHRGMNAMAWLARRGWVTNWSAYARHLQRVSEWFARWGSDSGAMHVRVRGCSRTGAPIEREWTLVARDGHGPFVPTLAAAALVRRLAQGADLPCGAMPCVGVLTLAEILSAADGLSISTGDAPVSTGLFRQAAGAAYERMHPAVRAFHDLQGSVELQGEVATEPPQGWMATVLAVLLGTPRRGDRGAIRFELRGDAEAQEWIRHFPGRTMRSRLRGQGDRVVETLGPVRLVFTIREENGSLVMQLDALRCLGMPCPRWLLPTIHARETGSGSRLEFDVRATLPLVGQVAGYKGWLRIPETAA